MRYYSDDTRFWITAAGRQSLLDDFIESFECSHTWELVRRGHLECTICGTRHRISAGTRTADRGKRP